MNRLLKCFLSILLVTSALQLQASTMLIDRGLPTANLNNAAGASRSNVAWAFGSDASGDWLVGDTFTNTSGSDYAIDTIRLWTVGSTNTASLWGGLAGSAAYGVVSSTYLSSTALYSGGATYQGTSGSSIAMTQLDFAVNFTLAAGQTFNFFLNGTSSGSPFIPFVHSSNAALGGAPADGADDTMLYGLVSGGSIAAADVGNWTPLDPPPGWDKTSDVNVQVFGATVPDSGSTLSLLALALVGLAFRRRR